MKTQQSELAVDFIGNSKPLTVEEQTAIDNYFNKPQIVLPLISSTKRSVGRLKSSIPKIENRSRKLRQKTI